MKQYFINKNSDSLILFFAGWGCDEYEFEHLKSDSEVLILYDYTNLDFSFDFSKYKKIDVLAFSAGVFVSSVIDFDFKVNKKIAVNGNPHLFDNYYGLSSDVIDLFRRITPENADEFAKNYLIKTEDEYNNFHPSKRTIESCNIELDALSAIYNSKKSVIKDSFDIALISDSDPIFNFEAQQEFYGKRLRVIKNARHNPFFRINFYEELMCAE